MIGCVLTRGQNSRSTRATYGVFPLKETPTMSEEDRTKLEETAGGEERIDEIIACYLDARESGSGPSVEAILARYPDYEKELREFFGNEKFVRGVLTPRDRPYFGDD